MMMRSAMALLIAVFVSILALFIGLVLIVSLAPSIGQIGGFWTEVFFVLFAGFMTFAVIVAFLLGRR